MNRREFLVAFGAGLSAAKKVFGQEKKEEAPKPEGKNETYKKVLEQTAEAEKRLADLEKTDFATAKSKVDEARRAIDEWRSDALEQASKVELPKDLPEDKLREFSKQLEILEKTLESELDNLEKINPNQNPENDKINRGWLGLVGVYTEVAKFMDSKEFKNLNEAEQKQLTDWKSNFRPKLIALRDAITPFRDACDNISEKFEDKIQEIAKINQKLSETNTEALNKILEILSKPK